MAKRDEEANKVISTAMRFVKTGDRSDLELFTLPILKKTIYQLGDLDKGTGFRDAIEDLIKEREEARQKGDYSSADMIRKNLLEENIILEDSKEGTFWRRR